MSAFDVMGDADGGCLALDEERTCQRSHKPGCDVCSSCGYVLRDEDRYCGHCGARIDDGREAKTPREMLAESLSRDDKSFDNPRNWDKRRQTWLFEYSSRVVEAETSEVPR